MKHIKIAAGLAHVNYGRIADLVKEVSDAGVRQLKIHKSSKSGLVAAFFVSSP